MSGDRQGPGGGGIYRRDANGAVVIDAERVNPLVLSRDGFRRQKNYAEADRLQKELLAMVHCTA